MVSRLFEAGAPDVLYLVDLSGYVFRAYHAIQPLTSPGGEPTQAVLGTVNMLERLLKQCRPQLLAVAMDAGKQTFRRDVYPEYKAHRREAPPDFHHQMKRVEDIVRALGVPILFQAGVEADDLIASAVSQARRRNLKTVVVSSDKDLLCLVGPDVVLWDTMRDRVLGPDDVAERYAVRVEQMTDLLALMGDSSDNIPGVPSVGPKTAAELLNEFGSIDGIYSRLPEVKRKKLRETLEANREQAFLSRRLVALKDDCPVDLDRLGFSRANADIPTVTRIYTELDFQRQLQNLLAESEPKPVPVAREVSAPELRVTTLTTVAELNELIHYAKSSGRLAVFALGEQVGTREDLIGVALALDASRIYYVPLAHRYVGAPPQLGASELRAAFGALEAAGGVQLAAYDAKHVRSALAGFGVSLPEVAGDVLLAAYLLDPENDNTLEKLAERSLGLDVGSLEALATPKRGQRTPFDLIAVDEVAPLVGKRVYAVAELWPKLALELEAQGLLDVYRKIELPLSHLLGVLEARGVLVDVKALAAQGAVIEKRLVELELEAQRVAGRAFNVHSPRQLEVLLFDELGLKPLKRTKTSRSTDAATLEALADKHALPQVVLEIRQLAKLKSTYIDALPTLVNPRTGRIHTRWGQATAATGRLASSEPNLQNIPIRSELGRAIRSAFVAPEGYAIVSADYSQIELRVLAHLSQDPVFSPRFAATRTSTRAPRWRSSS